MYIQHYVIIIIHIVYTGHFIILVFHCSIVSIVIVFMSILNFYALLLMNYIEACDAYHADLSLTASSSGDVPMCVHVQSCICMLASFSRPYLEDVQGVIYNCVHVYAHN